MSFSFGTPSSAPASSGLTGFSFGANKPSTPGFGLGTSQPSTGLFGTPATSAPAFGSTTPAFGANTSFGGAGFGSTTQAFGATSTAPGFGATSTAPTFGATSTAPTFGAATQAFGATSAAPAFGSTTPAFGSTTPAFGATSTAPAFGATSAAPTFGATSSAPLFGSTTPAFGATTSTPAFGSTTTPAFGTTSLGTGLGTGGLNFGTGTNSSTATTGLTLGAPTTSAPGLGGLGGFGFGTTATSTQSTGLGGFFATSTAGSTGLFAPKQGTTTVTGSLQPTSATPSLGLGGVAPTGASTNAGDGKTEPPLQTKLPNELLTTVESFKEFVKKQKSLSADVMRVSIKPFSKVSRGAESTLREALSLSGEVRRARAQSRRLRQLAAAALAAAETIAIAPGSELEGSAPPKYVKEVIAELEQQLLTFRRQMDVADKQMQAQPKLLTEQELTLGIRRMHESLVALAGRLQAVHAAVSAARDQYLNLRKYILKDPTNVFDTIHTKTSLDEILHDAEGTRKKSKTSHLGTSFNSTTDPRTLGNIQQLAGPTPFTYLGNSSPFPVADSSAPTWQPQPQANLGTSLNSSFGTQSTETGGFQLQKPPGKRGKQ